MTDVFLCYARSDLDFARHLAEALRERTTDMFVDLGEWWHDELAGEPIRASEEPADRAGWTAQIRSRSTTRIDRPPESLGSRLPGPSERPSE